MGIRPYSRSRQNVEGEEKPHSLFSCGAETQGIASPKKGYPAMDHGRNFQILISPGQDCYVAQFLECDIVTQAPTFEELRDAIKNIYAAHVDFAQKEGRLPFDGLEPAPKEHWETFNRLKDRGCPLEAIAFELEHVEEAEPCRSMGAMLLR
jgi:predicted RNase H-like HicB family nuclease